MRNQITRLDQSLAWHWLPDITRYAIEQSTRLQQIPAPTFAEKERAQYILREFQANHLYDVAIDDLYNVYGRLPGTDSTRPAIMVSAHSDTVFPANTDLSLRQDGSLIYGPGLGDNCFGLGGLLGLLAALTQQQITPQRDIWFVVTSREEGMGDLGGMKGAYQTLKDRIGGVVNLEGLAFGHVYHAGIAVRRLHITATTSGGHSWLHFGRPSAVHGILSLGSHILNLTPSQSPRTTFNVGMIDGGQGINVIATKASMWLDLRSEAPEALAQIEQQVRTFVSDLTTAELQYEIEVVGDRPAGRIADHHPLVQAALSALAQVGVDGVLETGSTDANIPLAYGCPAVTVGITRGGNAHRLDEFVETEPVSIGLKQLILLVLAAAESL